MGGPRGEGFIILAPSPVGGRTLGKLHVASEGEILRGETTDVYFQRTLEVLHHEGRDGTQVLAEFTTYWLHGGEWPWGIFAGLEDCVHILESHDVTLRALPEGTLFTPKDPRGVRLPVMTVEGPYREFCIYETPLLGMVCQATAIATKAARVKRAAGDRTVISFGLRRMHPAIAPMIDRSAYLGGCDAVSGVLSAKTLGLQAQGTMPHALVILMGDPRRAFMAYDKHLPKDIPRICLVDTFYDEKAEALMAAEAVKDLQGVRLDTPSSRRGNLAEIVREVRWELDRRGFGGVKIFLSGGLDEYLIPELVEAGADGFGVGTAISNAPTVDFALDIVEVDGRAVAKRGKFSGRKEVLRCPRDLTLSLTGGPCPRCHGPMEAAMRTYLEHGRIAQPLPSPQELRRYVLEQVATVPPTFGEPTRN